MTEHVIHNTRRGTEVMVGDATLSVMRIEWELNGDEDIGSLKLAFV